jgi:hypothetical protein
VFAPYGTDLEVRVNFSGIHRYVSHGGKLELMGRYESEKANSLKPTHLPTVLLGTRGAGKRRYFARLSAHSLMVFMPDSASAWLL